MCLTCLSTVFAVSAPAACPGGTVSARSVKLLDRIHHPEESETRDAWWTEVRTEVRSHCKALACNVVLGYEEATTIW